MGIDQPEWKTRWESGIAPDGNVNEDLVITIQLMRAEQTPLTIAFEIYLAHVAPEGLQKLSGLLSILDGFSTDS